MRRLWAHILLAFTAILIMGTTFPSIFTKLKSNLEYADGNEIIYRLTDRDDPTLPIDNNDGVKKIAGQMGERLDNIGITSYSIYTAGNDMIKVQFADTNTVNKFNVVNYLSFNGSLALTNMDDGEHYAKVTGDEFLLKDQKAYLSNINGYPTVVIPVDIENPNYKTLIDETKEQNKNGVGEKTQSDETDEDGNPKTITTTYLYLWYDFNELTDDYSRTIPDSEDYDENIANKIIMKFNIDNLYFPDEQENKLAASLNVDTDGDGTASFVEIRNSYDNARFYVNLLNADQLDYDVTYANQSKSMSVNPWVESLITNSDPYQYVAWSRTLIAMICAIIITSLLLVLFFKLGALSVGVCSLLALYSSIGFVTLLAAEFNIATIVGIMLVTVASLVCGVIYLCKFKDECYKGRSLKKANSEAGRKSLLVSIDVHVVLMIVGALVYAFGGAYVRAFGLVTVIGGLVSLFINILGLRGMMWLATNTTALTGKYSVFGIDQTKVPSLLNEEKQTYFGPYADKDFTKKKNPVFFTCCSLFVAALAGLITFGVINNGQPFNSSYNAQYTEIYISTTTEDGEITNTDYAKSNILDHVYITYNDEAKNLSSFITSEESYSYTKTIDKIPTTTTYKVFKLNANVPNNTSASFDTTGETASSINELFESISESFDHNSIISLKAIDQVGQSKLNFTGILLGTSIAVLILTVYLSFRYKLSRGLACLVTTIIPVTITAGFFCLIRATLPVATPILIPFVAAFTLFLSIIFVNKEKDLQLDDRNYKTLTVEEKETIMLKANSISFLPIIISTILMTYLAINFFGIGPTVPSLIYIEILVGVLLAALVVTTLNGVFAQFFAKLFKNIHINRKPRKNNKKKQASRSVNEPEEVVFIGIND